MRGRRGRLALGVAALTLLAARPATAQIVTENGGVISPETPIVRESVSVLDAEHVKELRWNNQLIVADPWLPQEFKLTVPVVAKFVDLRPGGPRDDIFGLGDVSLRVKQSV